ncbi:NSS family neurotransmitter:Na+ symporter [Caldalkalibacillus uzonensis]|uniref:NSS family neurotransmitter:Na+ symporter n=1 Tax=Caldalkalibacillus uzonensis TaxID=353224 RepID=A0ABU0CR10_9BACI|nr:sodium-dependent transporter [Caldalkalibacillus uzonensis]MDQ0338863.1 NSS family neurotransmitter:Na+ symporter [Caldalkalibacillus uzonensis]
MINTREEWGTRLGFMLAAAGSAIGLGNIWRFPFVAGEGGGAAFVLIYLGFVLLIGLPLMIGEIAIGRKGRANAMDSYRAIRPEQPWHVTGLLGIVSNFMILCFYSVVAGWTLYYFILAATGRLLTSTKSNYGEAFGSFISHPFAPVIWQSLLMIIVSLIVAKGVKQGIERWNNILMPVLFVLLLVLAVRSLTLSGGGEGLAFFLRPDFSSVTSTVVLAALGQAFFSLSLATGLYVTYGSYCRTNTHIPANAGGIVFLDVLVAVIAGLIIFPAVFHFGIDPGRGPDLVFVTFPAIFSNMPLGGLFAALFFFCVFLAALTSAISLLEVVVAYVHERWALRRVTATWLAGLVVLLVGLPCALSFGPWADATLLDRTVFDWFDFLAASVLLPFAGLLLALFLGWGWKPEQVKAEVEQEGVRFQVFPLWRMLIRYVIPVALVIIFLQSIGLI